MIRKYDVHDHDYFFVLIRTVFEILCFVLKIVVSDMLASSLNRLMVEH